MFFWGPRGKLESRLGVGGSRDRCRAGGRAGGPVSVSDRGSVPTHAGTPSRPVERSLAEAGAGAAPHAPFEEKWRVRRRSRSLWQTAATITPAPTADFTHSFFS